MNAQQIELLAANLSRQSGISVTAEEQLICGSGDSQVAKEIIRYGETVHRVASDPQSDAAARDFSTFNSRLDSLQKQGFRISRIKVGGLQQGGSIKLVLEIGHAARHDYHPDYGTWEIAAHKPQVGQEVSV